MTHEDIVAAYFEWICAVVAPNNNAEYLYNKYSNLLKLLYSIEFTADNAMDDNRRMDGIDLRIRFCNEQNLEDYHYMFEKYPCSLLEMMVALALRCEETIMIDTSLGNRTHVWFEEMLHSLDILKQTNEYYNENYVKVCITKLYQRQYDYYGRGGLFTAMKTTRDMRSLDIWSQMQQYLIEYDERDRRNIARL